MADPCREFKSEEIASMMQDEIDRRNKCVLYNVYDLRTKKSLYLTDQKLAERSFDEWARGTEPDRLIVLLRITLRDDVTPADVFAACLNEKLELVQRSVDTLKTTM